MFSANTLNTQTGLATGRQVPSAFTSKRPSQCTVRITKYPSQQRVTRSETSDLCTGSLAHYLMGRIIGQGAYAVVREATHLATKEVVAVKSYEKQRLSDPARRRNLLREIKILQRLDHEHLVCCREAIDDARRIHIVMELVDGVPLAAYLRRLGKVPEAQARPLFIQLLKAVEYLHRHAITHRDLKLENVLLTKEKTVKVIDFGFSTDSPEPSKVFCGTPSYMAPEIILKKEFDGAPADVWALGVLLFVLLTGYFPFKGLNDRDLFRRILKGDLDVPETVHPQCRLMIKRMLQLDPAKRPTASQLLQEVWVNLPSLAA